MSAEKTMEVRRGNEKRKMYLEEKRKQKILSVLRIRASASFVFKAQKWNM